MSFFALQFATPLYGTNSRCMTNFRDRLLVEGGRKLNSSDEGVSRGGSNVKQIFRVHGVISSYAQGPWWATTVFGWPAVDKVVYPRVALSDCG